jgi:hypothetical protein
MKNVFGTRVFFFYPYHLAGHGRKVFVFLFIFLLGSGFALAAHAQSETKSFFIESTYDVDGRGNIEAVLVRTTPLAYFYVEKSWWKERSAGAQNNLKIALFELGQEFQRTIYPVLTLTFGAEPRPGIDGDMRITVLIHPMSQGAGGYFNSGDVRSKFQVPRSNEREMVYLNSEYLGKPAMKSFLAHEFIHLITAEQKDLKKHITEETWLNEARAEYAPTLLGYDNTYEGSNLQRRIRDFLENPSDSLTEWLNQNSDYGIANMFIQYIADHYGTAVLVDSLHSSAVGIASLNEALKKNGFQEDFDEIFRNWTIAVLLNDCSLGKAYCYKNKNLSGLRVTPTSYYIPNGDSVFSTYHTASYWAANWHRFVGGGQDFDLEFKGTDSVDFELAYVLCGLEHDCSAKTLALNADQRGAIILSEFNTAYTSLTIIPFLKGKTFGFNGREDSFLFSWTATGQRAQEADEEELIVQLVARVAQLQDTIRQLQARLAVSRVAAVTQAQAPERSQAGFCASFDTNLSFGVRNNSQVRCLQEFLKSQVDIYPEGLVTGNFLSLTRQAVIRFQEKYASDILAPVQESRGTGYVGPMTRDKINQILEM